MLRAVGHPVAVNPDAELERVPGRAVGDPPLRSSAALAAARVGGRRGACGGGGYLVAACGRTGVSGVDAEGSAGSLPDSSGAVLPGCRISTPVGSGAQPLARRRTRRHILPPVTNAVVLIRAERDVLDLGGRLAEVEASPRRTRLPGSGLRRDLRVAEPESLAEVVTTSLARPPASPGPPPWSPRGLLGARPRGDVRHRDDRRPWRPLRRFRRVPARRRGAIQPHAGRTIGRDGGTRASDDRRRALVPRALRGYARAGRPLHLRLGPAGRSALHRGGPARARRDRAAGRVPLHAGSIPRCTGAGSGPCGSSPASGPPRRPTSGSATCSSTADGTLHRVRHALAHGSRLGPPLRGRGGGRASRWTRSTTWRPSSRASRWTRSRPR